MRTTCRVDSVTVDAAQLDAVPIKPTKCKALYGPGGIANRDIVNIMYPSHGVLKRGVYNTGKFSTR